MNRGGHVWGRASHGALWARHSSLPRRLQQDAGGSPSSLGLRWLPCQRLRGPRNRLSKGHGSRVRGGDGPFVCKIARRGVLGQSGCGLSRSVREALRPAAAPQAPSRQNVMGGAREGFEIRQRAHSASAASRNKGIRTRSGPVYHGGCILRGRYPCAGLLHPLSKHEGE